jgi:P27 family predicted phage terminase small subunit
MTAIPLSPQRLKPPPDLSGPEKEIFVAVVGALSKDHFIPSDLPLIIEYCTAVAQCREAAHRLLEEGPVTGRHVSPWLVVQEKSTRTMLALATRLRLSPQSRARTKVVPTAPISYYDKMRMLERDDADGRT